MNKQTQNSQGKQSERMITGIGPKLLLRGVQFSLFPIVLLMSS